MDETKQLEFFLLIGSKGTRKILQYLCKHGKGQYKDFDLGISVPTISTRLSKLLEFNLIEHHLQKEPARKEWYEITEKGREISKYLEDLVATLYGDEQRIPEP
jgi:DNA-binding HxlR family transcriptional regulator